MLEAKSIIMEFFPKLKEIDTSNDLPLNIAKAIKKDFKNSILDSTKGDLPRLNEVLYEKYVTLLPEEDRKSIKASLATEREFDEISSLETELETIKNISNWKKLYQKTDFYEPLSKYIGAIIKIINENPNDCDDFSNKSIAIAGKIMQIFYTSSKYEPAEQYKCSKYLETAMDIFKRTIPNLYNSCIYTYFFTKCLISDIKSEDIKVAVFKPLFDQFTTLAIVDTIQDKLSKCIQSDLMWETDSTIKEADKYNVYPSIFDPDKIKNQFARVNTYFGPESNMHTPISDWIGKNSKINGEKSESDDVFRRKIFYACFACLLWMIRKADSKHLADFYTKKAPCNIEWAFADSVFKDPTDDEKEILELLRRSFIRKKLDLFNITEQAILGDNGILKPLKKAYAGKQKDQIFFELNNIVKTFEKINVDFKTFGINFQRDKLDTEDNVIAYLKRCEEEHIEFCKNDVYLSQDVKRGNMTSIKNALQYRASNKLNISILDIYQKIEDRITEKYFDPSLKEVIRKEYTEQDLIDKLNDFAWQKFSTFLHYSDANLSEEVCVFFEQLGILTRKKKDDLKIDNIEFCSDCEYYVCSGVGFSNEKQREVCFSNEKQRESDKVKQISDGIIKWLKKILDEEKKRNSEKIKSHLDLYSKHFLEFSITALVNLPKILRNKVIIELCNYEKMNISAENRTLQQTLILMLNLLLIDSTRLGLNGDTSTMIIDRIYNRGLFPQQLFILNNIKNHPLMSYYLDEKTEKLSNPKLDNNEFPSPFYIYLYAAKKAYEDNERREKGEDSYFKIYNQKYNLNKDIKNIDDFYNTAVVLNGISWRLVNENNEPQVDEDVFNTLFEVCEKKCPDKDKAVTEETLRWTWGVLLLFTSFSNFSRNNLLSVKLSKDKIPLAVKADYTQRKHTLGYQDFLNANDKAEVLPEFFMMSSAIRYTSLFFASEKENAYAMVKDDAYAIDNMVKDYFDWVCKEKKPRFLVLMLRYLTFTNFFEKIDNKDKEKIKNKLTEIKFIDMINDPEKHFLAYDNITKKQLEVIQKLINNQK